jgi:hypothetical protein
MKSFYAVIPRIRQVSKTRLHQLMAQTSVAMMARIDEALAIYLGD